MHSLRSSLIVCSCHCVHHRIVVTVLKNECPIAAYYVHEMAYPVLHHYFWRYCIQFIAIFFQPVECVLRRQWSQHFTQSLWLLLRPDPNWNVSWYLCACHLQFVLIGRLFSAVIHPFSLWFSATSLILPLCPEPSASPRSAQKQKKGEWSQKKKNIHMAQSA